MLSHDILRQTILDLRQDYVDRGISVYDIGDGHCYDFAEAVLDRALPGWYCRLDSPEGPMTLETECFYCPEKDGYVDPFSATDWDFTLLETWGISIPKADQPRYNEIIRRHPAHGWIYFRGRHYDAEHPDGVENLFELNFFRRYLAKDEPTRTSDEARTGS
jgi:hypothetical protein